MRSRYRVTAEHTAHFITSTVVEWLPIFTTQACCDIIVRSLEYCRAHKGLGIHGWVIMDNHFHAVVSGLDLSRTIADLRKFTAHEVLEQLKAEGREWLLNQRSYFCASHKHASAHQVWQEGVHPQSIPSDAIMIQKLEYLHNNPVKRGLVAAPEHCGIRRRMSGCLGRYRRCGSTRGDRERQQLSCGDNCVPKQSLGTRSENDLRVLATVPRLRDRP